MRLSAAVVVALGVLGVNVVAQEATPPADVVATQSAPAVVTLNPETFRNPPGWDWLIEPVHLKQAGSVWSGKRRIENDEIVIFDQVDEKNIRVMLLTREEDVPLAERDEYRAVAFDEDGMRHYAGVAGISKNDTLVVHTFEFGRRMAAETILYLGVEKLDTSGRRAAMRAAVRDAKNEGIEVLRLPQLDKPLPLELTTIDGNTVSSEQLKGKVVLVDCWAAWDSACLKLRPVLRRVYDKWHEHGFEIVSISLDNSQRQLEEALAKIETPWPQVYVPRDARVRELWDAANGIRTLPRLLLIDREGMLRAELNPRNCEADIDAFMRVRDEQRAAQDFKIGDVGWLTGGWEGTAFGQDAEEYWTPATQGTMLGMFRLGSKSNQPVYEIMLITQETDGVTLRLMHFARELKKIDEEPLLLRLKSADARKMVWEGTDEELGLTLSYELRDRETVLITLNRLRDGKPVEDKFFMHRVD